MRTYQAEKDYFFIKNREAFPKLPSSAVDMEQPIDEKSFIAKPGTSDYIWVYAGNTYRTVTADKKLELPLAEDMSTISWDIYKNNGQFFAQMILFVSFDRDKPHVNFERIVEDICLTLEKNLTKFNELVKKFNMERDILKDELPITEQMLMDNLNVTVIITFHDPKMITNSLQKLPEDCSIYVKTKFIEEYEKDFEFKTTRCYVLTKEKGDNLFFLEKKENGFVEMKEIKCKNLGFLRKSLGESVYKSGILPDFSQTPASNGTCPSNLQILTDFLSRQQMAASKVSPSYTILIINKGKHKIIAVNPLIPNSTPVYPIGKKQTISFSIDHCKVGEVLLVQSHPGLLEEKNLLDHKDESKRTKTISSFNFTHIPTQLAFEAETLRRQAAETWKPLIAHAWLLLVSRLWIFQTALEDESFKLSDPADPIYDCLMRANLTNFGWLQKALNITQKSPDDQVEIEKEHVTEIKRQWREVNSTMTCWKRPFRFHNPTAPVELGTAVMVLGVDPVGHATKLTRFQAMPILPDNQKILANRSVRFVIDENYRTIISSCLPEASNPPLNADTIREYLYADDQFSSNHPVTAKLTVLYSPVFIEKNGWIEKFTSEREQILHILSSDIFNGIQNFLEYSNESLPKIRKWITEILTQSTFSAVNASLLFCLNIQKGDYQCRFLVGVGNNMALAFEKGESQPITKIGAMYEIQEVAVSLSSLKKPDKLGTGGIESLTSFLNPSRIRQEVCIQIAIVEDPSVEILLIPGRILTPESFMPMPGKESKLGIRTYTPDIKSLGIIEEKDSSPIKNMLAALMARRKKLLELITDKNMISAWNKLEKLSGVTEEKSQSGRSFFPEVDFDKALARITKSFKEPTEKLLDSSSAQTFNEAEELSELNYCSDCDEFISKVNEYFEPLNLEPDSSTELDEAKEKTGSISNKLTDLESEVVTKLWQAAIHEEKDLPTFVDNDYANIVNTPEMNWNKIRNRYFLYFQGLTDSIALFVPTQTIEQPKLIEYIHGLGQFYFNTLNIANRGSEAQEILTFAHLLCLLPNEKAILKTINGKLNTFDQYYLDNLAPKFWIQLIKLLTFLYLPKADLYENPANNLEQLQFKLIELSSTSSQTTSRSSELISQSFLTSLVRVLVPSSDSSDHYGLGFYPY